MEERRLFQFGEKSFYEADVLWIRILFDAHISMLKGDIKSCLKDNHSCDQTSSWLKKFFSDVDPVGKALVNGCG